MTKKVRKWMGTPPAKCDICQTDIKDEFIDGKTVRGPWGNMCLSCHSIQGIGIGNGIGQHYKSNGTDFIKIAG